MFSIAVCTYNRSEQLSALMDQLAGMSAWLNDNVELIIVNNNSSDDTLAVLETYQKKFSFRVVTEKQQGLSAARNRAIEEFNENVLLFWDDDIRVSQTTLEQYKEAFKSQPEMGFFGGKIYIDWPSEQPNWYEGNKLSLIDGMLGSYDLGDQNRVYNDNDLKPYGANFALRRTLIDVVGKFNTELGVKGEGIGRGEESDFLARAISKGFKGMYLANAVVGHYYDSGKLTPAYLYRYGIEKGKCLCSDQQSNPLSSLANIVFYFMKGIFQLLKGKRGNFYQCVINMGIKHALFFTDKK